MNDKRPRTKTISAGEVILLSLTNEDRPCDKIMAILLNPIKVKKDEIVGSLELAYSIVVEKGQFLGHGKRINKICADITVVKDKGVKAKFFEKVMELNQKEKEGKNEQ